MHSTSTQLSTVDAIMLSIQIVGYLAGSALLLYQRRELGKIQGQVLSRLVADTGAAAAALRAEADSSGSEAVGQ